MAHLHLMICPPRHCTPAGNICFASALQHQSVALLHLQNKINSLEMHLLAPKYEANREIEVKYCTLQRFHAPSSIYYSGEGEWGLP